MKPLETVSILSAVAKKVDSPDAYASKLSTFFYACRALADYPFSVSNAAFTKP